jgi:hypothetical protein
LPRRPGVRVIATDAASAGSFQLSVAVRELTSAATAASAGGVASYWRVAVAEAWLPAASTQPPETSTLALSGPEYVAGAVQELIPEPPSVPAKVTSTGWEYQPFASGGRDGVAVTVGAVVS